LPGDPYFTAGEASYPQAGREFRQQMRELSLPTTFHSGKAISTGICIDLPNMASAIGLSD